MHLSVVVPTLNARDDLAGTLDALASHVPGGEVIVVNGPSADGTTGMVQDHEGADVLVDIADRAVNAARNAGIEQATGDVVAFVNQGLRVSESWADAVRKGIDGAAAVTGPTRTQLRAGVETERPERREIRGRSVTYLNPGNATVRRSALETLDGFDEYLATGGARDLAHRLAGAGLAVAWDDDCSVGRDQAADGGAPDRDWGWKYRSLAYRLIKNYGLRPTVVGRLGRHAGGDAVAELRRVLAGDLAPSGWLGTGRDVVANVAGGGRDGFNARRADAAPRRNPNGWSARDDRAVSVYDWRSELDG